MSRQGRSVTQTYGGSSQLGVGDGIPGHVISGGATPKRSYEPSPARLLGSTVLTNDRLPSERSLRPSIVQERSITGESKVLREEVVEHEIKVPRKRIVEETVEKTIVVPETVTREEVVNESVVVRERIVEVAKPVYYEKIVEVPEIEYQETIVEVPEKIVQEKIKQVPRIEVQEHITYVPKIITQEKVVEVPEVEIREKPIEKIIEVPEVRDEVVIKEVEVPRYVEVPVAEYKEIEVPTEVQRNVPVPVECITTVDYRLPQIQPRYERVPVPIYAPRFIEVAVPVEQLDEATAMAADQMVAQVAMVAASGAPSLCEIEKLAESAKNFAPPLDTNPDSIQRAWQEYAMNANEIGETITTHPRRYAGDSGAPLSGRSVSRV